MGRPVRRDRAVLTYLKRELYPHSDGARARIDAAGVSGGNPPKSLAELKAIAPVGLEDVGDAGEYVLRPTRLGLIRSGSPYVRARTVWASTWGRWHAYLAAIEPLYRPVHFFAADSAPIGASAADLVRLAGLGAEWMRGLGLTRGDTVALVGGASGAVEAWELSGGTRRAGVPLAVVEDAATLARHAVSVVAGTEDAVLRALANGHWPALRIVLVLGPTADKVAKRLTTDAVVVRRAWSIPGTRSVWWECRGGSEYGWHTSPTADFIELDDHDEVVWTGIGWAGTVFLRLRTDVRASRVDASPCPACGHVGERVFTAEGRPALARWLHADPRVSDWRLTSQGAEVLPARAGANARLVNEAKKAFPDHPVTVKTKKSWSDG
jgi:hypothetical protein